MLAFQQVRFLIIVRFEDGIYEGHGHEDRTVRLGDPEGLHLSLHHSVFHISYVLTLLAFKLLAL